MSCAIGGVISGLICQMDAVLSAIEAAQCLREILNF